MNSGISSKRLRQTVRVLLFSVVLLTLVLPAAYAATTQLWVKRYNGPVNEVDEASSMAFDANGNVYVTGRSTGSGSGEDYVTIKYGPGGHRKWVRRYDGPGGKYDGAKAIAVDGSGNVYVTGRSFGAGGNGDYCTIKYDSGGTQKWVKRYNGTSNADDSAMAIAIDSSGNVYVTGFSTGSGTAYDFVTIKYTPGGAQSWVKVYNGPDSNGDLARAIAIDSNDNVYVTGPSNGDDTSWDYATVKYNSAGVRKWVRRWNGSSDGNDGATAITVDGSNNVYVTGYSYRTAVNVDYITIKYGAGGHKKWVRRYDAPAGGPDVAWDIAADDKAVYVTGSSLGRSSDTDYATVRYTFDGVKKWVRRYNGPAGDTDVANAITTGNGRVYVTGFSESTNKAEDYTTIAYGAGGHRKWVARYSGPGGGFDQGNDVVVAPSGHVYVTGGSRGVVSGVDYATVKYTQ
jgi:hypothetical protein